jgi:flavin reductase (DIM6/NTAB) family NADH-FMN oxidoreductase RutF
VLEAVTKYAAAEPGALLAMAPKPAETLDRYFLTTVALITTHSSKGDNVMAAEWTFNVSYDPLLIAVVVGPRHATHAAILESGEFGVSMASTEQFALASFAGGFSRDEADKLSSDGFKARPGRAIKARLIEGSLAQMECKLVSQHKVGDHTMFIGEVVAGEGDASKEPLSLYRGYRRLGEEVVRGRHLFVTATREGAGVRGDGMYYADERAGKEVELKAVEAARRPTAGGSSSGARRPPGSRGSRGSRRA